MDIRDELITGTFAIGQDGRKEPPDWKDYAIKLERKIESYNEEMVAKDWMKFCDQITLGLREENERLRKALEELMFCYERDGHLLNFNVNIARSALKAGEPRETKV